ncbi:hypothetical protein [Streptomyces sp. OE57]|uniref:hypothetical protein n=1 Tax=Streptomyces lacaronensis TaxID=3379885 RepID=UPI0039B72891
MSQNPLTSVWRRLRNMMMAALLSATAVITASPAAHAAAPVPPALSGKFVIANAGHPGMLLCASPVGTNVTIKPLTMTIDPNCVWQQSGPDNDFYLYSPAKNLVLDLNTTGPLGSPTPVNLQPYYTNPLQSYEQWSWSGQTGYGGRAIRPFDDNDLNLNGQVAVTVTDWNQNRASMSWSLLYLG